MKGEISCAVIKEFKRKKTNNQNQTCYRKSILCKPFSGGDRKSIGLGSAVYHNPPELEKKFYKYIRTNNLIGNTTTPIGFAIFPITNRDTIIDNTFYIPKKAYIKVNLNNFVPLQDDDFFEVQTLYPFGTKIGTNPFQKHQNLLF